MRIPIRRPSPALVISCVALAIALGGTSYATVLQVPRNSVGPAQLKTAAVTNKKIAAQRSHLGQGAERLTRPGRLQVGLASGRPRRPAGPAGPGRAARTERRRAGRDDVGEHVHDVEVGLSRLPDREAPHRGRSPGHGWEPAGRDPDLVSRQRQHLARERSARPRPPRRTGRSPCTRSARRRADARLRGPPERTEAVGARMGPDARLDPIPLDRCDAGAEEVVCEPIRSSLDLPARVPDGDQARRAGSGDATSHLLGGVLDRRVARHGGCRAVGEAEDRPLVGRGDAPARSRAGDEDVVELDRELPRHGGGLRRSSRRRRVRARAARTHSATP